MTSAISPAQMTDCVMEATREFSVESSGLCYQTQLYKSGLGAKPDKEPTNPQPRFETATQKLKEIIDQASTFSQQRFPLSERDTNKPCEIAKVDEEAYQQLNKVINIAQHILTQKTDEFFYELNSEKREEDPFFLDELEALAEQDTKATPPRRSASCGDLFHTARA